MAFVKRTWLARIGIGLNKFIIGAKDGAGKQTLTNSPDSVTQQGDVISADNLNDLEDRIKTECDGLDADVSDLKNNLFYTKDFEVEIDVSNVTNQYLYIFPASYSVHVDGYVPITMNQYKINLVDESTYKKVPFDNRGFTFSYINGTWRAYFEICTENPSTISNVGGSITFTVLYRKDY